MKFKTKTLHDLELPWTAIEDTIVGKGRWSIKHQIVFEHEGKFYQTNYSVGATETQDEGPWEYMDEVDCTEVAQVEKLVKVWEPIVVKE